MRGARLRVKPRSVAGPGRALRRQTPPARGLSVGTRALLILSLLVSGAASTPPGVSAQRTLDERHAAPPRGAVRIHLYAGSLRVAGWDRDSIVVTGTAHERGMDRFYIGVGEGGSKLGLWPQGSDSLPPSTLDVRVPQGSSVWIKTVDASIVVEAVRGGVDLYSVSGDIDVAGEPRELFAESMSGSIAARVQTRVARLKTASGALELRGRVDDAFTQTVSGVTLIHGGAIAQGRFESVDGGIRYDGAVARSARLDFVNHGGPVELRLPKDAAAELILNTFDGVITNALKARLVQTGRGFKGSDHVATLNGGGAHITVRTFKGPITLDTP